MELLNKWIRKFTATKEPQYLIPQYQCSSKILLCGPTYGDITYFGSFLLDSLAIKEWTLDHSKHVYSSNKVTQQARQFLPTWLDSVRSDSDNFVTLLDNPMRVVLVPYAFDFYTKGWLKVYCHQCCKEYDSIVKNEHDLLKFGNKSSWTDEWLCHQGHKLHHKDNDVRWIVRQTPKE